jgi:hypothetical protein
MTKIQASIKQGEIDEAIATCDKQQGSVLMHQLYSNTQLKRRI